MPHMKFIVRLLLLTTLMATFARHAQARFLGPYFITVPDHAEPWLDPDHAPIRLATLPGNGQMRGPNFDYRIRFLMVPCGGAVKLPVWCLECYVYPFESSDRGHIALY